MPAPERAAGLRLTATGGGVLLGAALLLLAGWAFGMPELLVIGSAGVVALLLALVAVALPLGLEVGRRFRPERVTVDAPAAGLLQFTNRTRLPVPGVRAVDRIGDRPMALPVPAVAPGRTAVVRTLLPTDRRGRLLLGPVRIERRDPLALVARWRSLGGQGVLWVRPRVHRADPLPTGVVLDLEGPVSDTATEGTLTFSSLREYVPGDDLRRIHWPTTARTGSLMVRTHVDTSQPRATVVLDTRAGPWDPARFEHGVEVVASVAQAFRAVGHAVDLQVLGEDRSSVAALGARDDLDRLALAQPSDATLAGLFGAVERATPGGALVVVTGDAQPGVVTRLATQRRRHAPVVVLRLVAGAPVTSRRRSGVLELVAPDARTAVGAWNRKVRR